MTDLTPQSEAQVQSRWLGAMQTELGVLKSNHMLMELRCEALMAQAIADNQLIDALKARALKAEENIRLLHEQIKSAPKPEPKAKPKRTARSGSQ